MKKICTKCEKEKEENEFCKDKRALSGLQSSCKMCQSSFRKKRYSNLNYRKKILNRSSNYKKNNKTQLAKKRKVYVKNNKKKITLTIKKYFLKNKKTINKKAREIQKIKRKTNPLFKLSGNLRTLIGSSFRKNGFTKNSRTYQIIGCTFEEFKTHIESKFEQWMTWNNHGKYNGEFNFGWDLDHIIPISSALNEEEIIKLNHYTNFQPLCSKINRYEKINKLDFYI